VTPELSVVVPAFNEEQRLPQTLASILPWLEARGRPFEVVLVDDGSSDRATVACLERYAASSHRAVVLFNDRNRGKGYCVARAMRAARGAFRVFTDADLAYPLDEIISILERLEDGCDIAVACRVLHDSHYVVKSSSLHHLYRRHLASRTFNRLVQLLLIPGVADSQAGLKGFTASAAETIFSRTTIAGFGFDVECLYIARQHGLRIAQLPVSSRYDRSSTVHLARDAARLIWDIARVRWRGWTGRYVVSDHPSIPPDLGAPIPHLEEAIDESSPPALASTAATFPDLGNADESPVA
jgi:dolichyl-phosphate beta-glucosyltransferase